MRSLDLTEWQRKKKNLKKNLRNTAEFETNKTILTIFLAHLNHYIALLNRKLDHSFELEWQASFLYVPVAFFASQLLKKNVILTVKTISENSDLCLGELVPMDELEPEFQEWQPPGTHHMSHTLKNYSPPCYQRNRSNNKLNNNRIQILV